MSVTKRKLKSAEELQAWIADRARYFPGEWDETAELTIVHQSPRAGSANWKAVATGKTQDGHGRRSGVVQSLIATAQMQFDLR